MEDGLAGVGIGGQEDKEEDKLVGTRINTALATHSKILEEQSDSKDVFFAQLVPETIRVSVNRALGRNETINGSKMVFLGLSS